MSNASFGEGRVQVDQWIVGSIRVLAVAGWPALSPVLRFTIGCRLFDLTQKEQWSEDRPKLTGYFLTDLEGEISAEGHTPLIGRLAWVGPRRRIGSVDYEHETQLQFNCFLSYPELERLEALRKGRPLTLHFDFWPRVQHEGKDLNAQCDSFAATIPRDQWLTALQQLRRDQYEILEVEFDAAYGDRFRTAIGELKEARRYVDEGDYPAAIVRCRKAMEILAATARKHGAPGEDVKALFEPIVGKDRAKAYAGVLANLKTLGNVELHQIVEHGFSRTEAMFAIRAGELLVYLYGGLLTQPREGQARRDAERNIRSTQGGLDLREDH